MAFQFLSKARVRATELLDDATTHLIKTYRQTADAFSYGTAFGQILLVVQNLYQVLLSYLADSQAELNLITAQRRQSIYGLSSLAGHDPIRGRSASGEVELVPKPDAATKVPGGVLYLPNYLRLRSVSTSLPFLLDMGSGIEDAAIDLKATDGHSRFIVREGELEVQQFTGTGEDLQTFEVAIQGTRLIDQDFVKVTVNGEVYERQDGLSDIPFQGKGCLVRSNIGGGLVIVFGNSVSCKVPPLGSQVRIDYLMTSGIAGNLPDATTGELEFVDTAFDSLGQEVKLTDYLTIKILAGPVFGANPEPVELTKLLAPGISRHHVIHDDRSLAYFLKRLNAFSVVRIFNDQTDSLSYNALLLPDLASRLPAGDDYFSVDTSRLLLSSTEKSQVLRVLEESGTMSGAINVRLQDMQIRRFITIAVVEVYPRYQGREVRRRDVRRDIRDLVSQFMLKNERVSRVPHSDLVRLIDQLPYVDTVKVVYVPERQQDVDSLGNIKVGDREMAVMRGGWNDPVSKVAYQDSFDPEGDALGSFNLHVLFSGGIEVETGSFATSAASNTNQKANSQAAVRTTTQN